MVVSRHETSLQACFPSNDRYSQLYCLFKPSDKVATGICLSVVLQLRRLSRGFNPGNATLASLESHKME